MRRINNALRRLPARPRSIRRPPPLPFPAYGLGPVGNGHAAIGLSAVFTAVFAGLAGAWAGCPRGGIAGFTADLAAGLREGFLAPAFFTAGLWAPFFFAAGIALFATFFFLLTGFFTGFFTGFLAGFFAAFFAFFLVAIFAISIKN